MKLITKKQSEQLIEQFSDDYPRPIVRIFSPISQASWLVYAQCPWNDDILYALCDLGMGEPELGPVSLWELESVQSPLPLERDLHFEATGTVKEYAEAARKHRRITVDL